MLHVTRPVLTRIGYYMAKAKKKLTQNDVVILMISEVKAANNQTLRAARLENELDRTISYYLDNWADCLALKRERQANVFRMHMDNSIELRKDFRVALHNLKKPPKMRERP